MTFNPTRRSWFTLESPVTVDYTEQVTTSKLISTALCPIYLVTIQGDTDQLVDVKLFGLTLGPVDELAELFTGCHGV